MTLILAILAVVVACFGAAYASRDIRVARALDAGATIGAKTIGTIAGVAIAVSVLAAYVGNTPIGRVALSVIKTGN
jgi:hypothetical protein